LNIDISEEAGVRYLHFGSSWVQGAMRIARPFALELDYTREMMVPLLLRRRLAAQACCRSGWAPPR
jgi:spermidine synthase